MTSQTDIPTQSADDAPSPSVRSQSPTRPFYWSVRRELWENRSSYIAPLIAAGVVLFGFLFGATAMRGSSTLDTAGRDAVIAIPYGVAAVAVAVTAGIVAAFYCLGALHNERRDRSILFWKSLPVSDLTTVLSKASIPLIVMPLIVFTIVVATHLIMVLVNAASLLLHGRSIAILWTAVPLFHMWLMLAYGLILFVLWYAPIWGWLLLVGSWARRGPFLWAVLPPLGLCLVEKIAFGSSHLATLLGYRLSASSLQGAFLDRAQPGLAFYLPQLDPVGLLGIPGVWIGLAVAAAFIGAAVWLRRYRDPI
jgi:ABC-2 type transport system permease protein